MILPPPKDYAVLRVKYGCDTVYIAWCRAEASAPVYILGEDGWTSTPYQTASARHREDELVRLVLDIEEDDPRWEDIELEYVGEPEFFSKE